jgi:hypothetical protein
MDSGMFWQKPRLVFIYEIVINKMIVKGNYCIPPLRNSINDQNIDDIAYDDSHKCELLNKYFSSISKLDEEHVTLPQFLGGRVVSPFLKIAIT